MCHANESVKCCTRPGSLNNAGRSACSQDVLAQTSEAYGFGVDDIHGSEQTPGAPDFCSSGLPDAQWVKTGTCVWGGGHTHI